MALGLESPEKARVQRKLVRFQLFHRPSEGRPNSESTVSAALRPLRSPHAPNGGRQPLPRQRLSSSDLGERLPAPVAHAVRHSSARFDLRTRDAVHCVLDGASPARRPPALFSSGMVYREPAYYETRARSSLLRTSEIPIPPAVRGSTTNKPGRAAPWLRAARRDWSGLCAPPLHTAWAGSRLLPAAAASLSKSSYAPARRFHCRPCRRTWTPLTRSGRSSATTPRCSAPPRP